MTEPSWFAIPNLNGRVPAMAPPKDRPFIARNEQNRRDGEGAKRFPSEHLVFWEPTEGCFVRLTDDLFRDTVFTFFHLWRDIEP